MNLYSFFFFFLLSYLLSLIWFISVCFVFFWNCVFLEDKDSTLSDVVFTTETVLEYTVWITFIELVSRYLGLYFVQNRIPRHMKTDPKIIFIYFLSWEGKNHVYKQLSASTMVCAFSFWLLC